MMKFLLLTALALVAANALGLKERNDFEWENFKVAHAKSYETEKEEALRKNIFMSNLKLIRSHNQKFEAGLETYSLAVNEFADLTHREFRSMMNTYRSSGMRNGQEYTPTVSAKDLPAEVDWRSEGAVTPVKNQGSCGSCWSFSTTGSIEGQHFLKTNKLVSLSEQQLVDCSTENDGCNGGLMDLAFQYVIDNKGIDTESSYSYKGRDGKCKFTTADVAATISSFSDVESGSEDDLQTAVATVGPVSIAMDASAITFQFYSGGVYSSIFCGNSQAKLDHGVLAVGYGHRNQSSWLHKGGDYWLVKNSWGSSWGLKGYFMLARNMNNMCGVATEASFPTV